MIFPKLISHVIGDHSVTPFRVGIGHVILGRLVSDPSPSSRNLSCKKHDMIRGIDPVKNYVT